MIPRWLRPDGSKGYRWYTVVALRDVTGWWLKLGPVTFHGWMERGRLRYVERGSHRVELCVLNRRCWTIWEWEAF